MGRLVAAVLLTAVLVTLGVANSHEVELDLVFGDEVEIELVFLFATALAAGVLAAVLRSLAAEARERRRRPRRRAVPRLEAGDRLLDD